MPLQDQVILISGCSTGIGRALSLELAGRGHRVFASARNPDSIQDLTDSGIEALPLDVTHADSIESCVKQVVSRAGRIDLLINNAGVNTVGPLTELPLEDVRRLLDTNVTGLLGLTQAVFPHMAQRRTGRIVNIGSVVGLLGTPFSGAYCASKAAVHMLSEVLRMEVSPFGIDVVVVQPGGVRSSIADTASQGIDRYQSEQSHYRAGFRGIQKRAAASQNKPMEAADFARRVADGLLADRPPRVIRAGRGAVLYPALSRAPSGLRQRIMSRTFELDSLP